MPLLKDILNRVATIRIAGRTDREVNGLCFDSRLVQAGNCFVAVRGTQSDGHAFIGNAVERGAQVVVGEQPFSDTSEDITRVQVKDSAEALGMMASDFYGNPSSSMKVVAVTGTNGKTTTVTLLHDLFRELGFRAGMFTTIQNKIDDRVVASTHTTPDAIQINRLMADMVKERCTYCFMEASSHALEQKRLEGLKIDVAVFTNITHDHLDYHKTFDAYLEAKKKLFDGLGRHSLALVNADDRHSPVMVQNTSATIKTYGLKNPADFKTRIISSTFQGLELRIHDRTAWFPMVGEFNAYNLTAIFGTAVLLGENEDKILTRLSGLGKVPGRFEKINSSTGIHVIVDYAHTPDALENVLKTIRDLRIRTEKIITVVGCGGNRDREKRPVMAAIACRLSDQVVLTSDNPRNEDPQAILEEMEEGIPVRQQRKALKIVDRKEAIKTACAMASKNDIILVAGKGHETYQEIKGVKYDFDDRKVVKEMLELVSKK